MSSIAEMYRTGRKDMASDDEVNTSQGLGKLTIVPTDERVSERCCHFAVNHFLCVLHRDVHVAIET